MSLHYVSFANVSIGHVAESYLGHIPSGCIMVGHVFKGGNCAYISVLQDQYNDVYGVNISDTATVTLDEGKLYYREL